jgi:type I restriction enzyme S subunit
MHWQESRMTDIDKLITENIDVWTSAISKKSSTGRGSNKKIELSGVKALRKLILELAVQGKLVQFENKNVNSQKLIDEILEEKNKLIKQNKLKKQKALPILSDEEVLFNAPNGWIWTRLGEVTNYGVSDKVQPNDVDDDCWVLELEDVEKNSSRLLAKVRFSERNFKSSKNKFSNGDVIYGKLRPYLDKVLVADESGVCTTEMIPVRAYANLDSRFLRLIMKTPYFINYANNSTHGMNLPRMGTDKARLAPILIAPLEEQLLIVAKIEELMVLCDSLEQQTEKSIEAHKLLVEELLSTLPCSKNTEEFQRNWARITEHFDLLFTTEHSIEQLKKIILQLSIMGKLVPQDPNDEPASKLLERILKEKKQLIKNKVITKQKTLLKIQDFEKKYELPIGWQWVRFGDVYDLTYGKNLPKPIRTESGEFIVYGSNGEVGSHNQSSVQSSCIVIGRKGSAGALNLSESKGCWVTDVAYSITPPSNMNLKFLYYQLHTCGLDTLGKGIKPGLNRNEAYEICIAMPPIGEQIRIVKKIDSLNEICDQLQISIAQKEKSQVELASSVVEKVLN